MNIRPSSMSFEEAMLLNVLLLHLLGDREPREMDDAEWRALRAAQHLADAACHVLLGPEVLAVIPPYPLDGDDVERLWKGQGLPSDPIVRESILAERRALREEYEAHGDPEGDSEDPEL